MLSASSWGCLPTSELRQQNFSNELSGGGARRQREQRGLGAERPPFVSVTREALLFEKPNLSRICTIDYKVCFLFGGLGTADYRVAPGEPTLAPKAAQTTAGYVSASTRIHATKRQRARG